jgi:hypothetical protein
VSHRPFKRGDIIIISEHPLKVELVIEARDSVAQVGGMPKCSGA